MAEASSGRRVAAFLLAAVTVWGSAGCSTPPHRSPGLQPVAATSSANPNAGPSATGASGDRTGSAPDAAGIEKVCFAAMPPGWAGGGTAVASPAGVGFQLNAVDDGAGYGTYLAASGTGVGRLDLATGRLTEIAPLSRGSGGIGWVSADGPWVVWEQLDSQSNQQDWSVHAWNRETGGVRQLATTEAGDGSFLPGQQALPAVRQGRVAWAQPVPSSDGKPAAELRVVDLPTGDVRVLATGRISSPVFAGKSLIWAGYDAAGGYAFHAVDADSLGPAPLPPQLGRPDSVGFLAGSPDYLAWTSLDETRLTVWRIGSAQPRVFGADDGRHYFQFLQVAGHFVLWFNSSAYSVLDVDTGGAFDVAGTAAGGSGWIALGQATGPSAPAPTAGPGALGAAGPVTTEVSHIRAESAPAVRPGC